MITVATLVRDTPYISDLFDMIERNISCDYELVVGDNSTNPFYSEGIKEFADEYIKISDKQLFRMGIPWAHNLINSVANTYKIMYIDSDEFPLWIHPEIEDRLDLNYILPTIRYDFFDMDEIKHLDKQNKEYSAILAYCDAKKDAGQIEGVSVQDRIYNSRYVQFDGNSHSIFHAPPHFRANEAGAILLHNRTVRLAKDKDRMDKLIDEQFMKANINYMLSSSEQVLEWGKHIKKHQFKDWKEWYEAY